MRCQRKRDIERWARLGAGAAIDSELGAHAEGCEVCRSLLAEIKETRRWFADEPGPELSKLKQDEIRFALEAATRTSPPRRSPVWGWVAVAAAVMLVVGAGLIINSNASSELTYKGAKEVDILGSLAQIEAGPTSDVIVVQPAPNEVQRLVDGVAQFRVRHLRSGEGFRVLAGDGTVEVRGTQFRVTVRDELLQRVEVEEGRVFVRLNGRIVANLSPNTEWVRPPQPPAEQSQTEVAVAPPRERPSPSPVTEEPPSAVDVDTEFQRGFRLFRAGDAAGAALVFEELLRRPELDGGRRGDILYWAARAHFRQGQEAQALERAQLSLRNAPNGWHADDARHLLEQLGHSIEGQESDLPGTHEHAAQP